MSKQFTLTEDKDIIVDTGRKICIITQDDIVIKRTTLKKLLKEKIIYKDRHQWGQDYYLVGDGSNRLCYGDPELNKKIRAKEERIRLSLSKTINFTEE